MVIRGHDQAVLYDADLHVVSALFRLRERADIGVDVWFCAIGPATGVRVNEGPIAEALVDGLVVQEHRALNARNRTRLGSTTRIHMLLYLLEHDPQP
jgi:hypothetical protein